MLTQVNDGYGDPESHDDQLRRLVGDYKGWITSMVRRISYDTPWRTEDLVQEAYIAMWKGLDDWDGRGQLEGYLRQKARWRVKQLCFSEGHHWTGHKMTRTSTSQKRGDETRARIKSFMREYVRQYGRAPSMAEVGRALNMQPQSIGKQMSKIGTIAMTENVGFIVEEYRTQSLDLLLELGVDPTQSAEKVDEVEVAYHYGEIHKAVSELPDRWREYVWLRFWGGLTDAQVVRSVDQVSRGAWTKSIRPELAGRLSHLATVY